MINVVRKKGISLIVLVITIIIIIILAGSVILSLANNNPIAQATEAAFKSDVSAFNSELQLWITSEYASNGGNFRPEDVNADNGDNKYNDKNIGDIITSLKGNYLTKFKIIAGRLIYVDNTNTLESKWANEMSVYNTDVQNGKNIYVSNAKAGYGTINSITGFSIQNTTPSPTSPAAILSTGDAGKVQLYTHAKNLFNSSLLTNASVTSDTVSFNITNQYDHLIFKNQLVLLPSTQYNMKMIITENTATLPIILQTIGTSAFETSFTVNPGQTGEINNVVTTRADFKSVLYDAWLWHSNTGTGNLKFKIQLTQGAAVQNYEPFTGSDYNITLPANFLLASLPSGVSDTIDSTGLCTQKITKSVLNGTESWTIRDINANTLEFLCSSALPNHVDNSMADILCDRFTVATGSADVEHIRSSTTSNKDYIVLYINKSRLATQDVAGLKSWLAANPTTIYYETSNVTTTKITLPLFKTYLGDTYITTKNSVQPTLNISYVK